MTEAEKREKVIKWLAEEAVEHEEEEVRDLAHTALLMLEEQEPRVMTEGDVLHSTGKPMWFESRGMYLGQKGFWCLSFEVDPESHFKFVQPLTGGRLTLSLNDYDKTWRVWDKYPSPEQMRDTKWEGDADD